MARSSIVRTVLAGERPEFVDERRAVMTARGLRDVECHDDAALRVGVQNVLDDGSFVTDARLYVSQNISHIIALLPVRIVAELTPDKYRPYPVLERQPVG